MLTDGQMIDNQGHTKIKLFLSLIHEGTKSVSNPKKFHDHEAQKKKFQSTLSL